ncbi:hypothetical protein CCAX7_22070 [Capsulimonas corticalis]|uniref:Uncharacterized protein n=1 Tax=Capsulimonas corticalis TaxID=2219043 RepID=A0A402D233_9BACT|nr:hypothetical protein [Capsulimonas corticalis]BDI30156.1 hypothetical protein CCAX7_22070 [Capsulimonas corticalis]
MHLKFVAIAAAGIALAVPAGACPTSNGNTLSCGSYTISGYHNAKNSALNAGASSTELAIGMLETDSMSSNYTYGDGKSGDSANFGFMKNNWYMYRVSCSQFAGQGSAQWNNGASANNNYGNAVNYCNQCINHFGWTSFWEVQRGGQGRIGNWNADTDEYYQAVNWIQQQISNNNSWHDDVRYWVSVPAI